MMTIGARRPCQQGFTLIELMVVLLITLIIMGLLTSFFMTTTKVVSVVELKLRLTEQARGILDTLEEQIINACANERGGLFVVKGVNFKDGDSNPRVSNNLSSTASDRKVDSINIVQTGQVGRMQMNNYSYSGGYPFPLAPSYTTDIPSTREYASVGLLSVIHYAIGNTSTQIHPTTALSTDYSAINFSGVTATLTPFKNDVSRLVYSMYKKEAVPNPYFAYHRVAAPGDPDGAGGQYYIPSDIVPHQLEPGYEFGSACSYSGEWDNTPNGASNFDDVHVMDLSISVWDETDRTYHRVPHLHAVYFAPIPKAIMISITVCEITKKGRISYSRVIRPPTGVGAGHFDSDTTKADKGITAKTFAGTISSNYPGEIGDMVAGQLLIANDKNHNHKWDPGEAVTNYLSLPKPHNRLKALRADPVVADSVNDFDPTFVEGSVFKP